MSLFSQTIQETSCVSTEGDEGGPQRRGHLYRGDKRRGGLSEQVGTVPGTLGKDGPGRSLGLMDGRVWPGQSRDPGSLGGEASFRSVTVKWAVGGPPGL